MKGRYTPLILVSWSLMAQAPTIQRPQILLDAGLHRAIQARNLTLVQDLLSKGANVNTPNPEGVTCLMLATQLADPGLVDLLLKHGARLDLRDQRACTALQHLGTKVSGEGAGLKVLACYKRFQQESKLDEVAQHPTRNSLLHYACRLGEPGVPWAQALVAEGADPKALNELKESPLDLAMHTAQPSKAGFLFLQSQGVSIPLRGPEGQKLLGRCIQFRAQEAVEWMLSQGCDVTSPNALGQTPLQAAAASSSPEILGILLKAGASVSAQGKMGTALAQAVLAWRYDQVAALLRAGAQPEELFPGQDPAWKPRMHENPEALCQELQRLDLGWKGDNHYQRPSVLALAGAVMAGNLSLIQWAHKKSLFRRWNYGHVGERLRMLAEALAKESGLPAGSKDYEAIRDFMSRNE